MKSWNLSTNINYKVSGPRSIPYGIFHLIKPIISEPLSEIINLYLETGSILKILKYLGQFLYLRTKVLSSNAVITDQFLYCEI